MHLRNCKGFLSGVAISGALSTLILLHVIQESPVQDFQEPDNGAIHKEGTCHPATKVAFVKVHKAGSSTVANILQRFGFTRDLNFVVPNKAGHVFGYNYIGNFGETVSLDNIIPLPPPLTYDILWNHVTYNHDAFRVVMPEGTKYVTILREPFDQFVSAFDYYLRSGKNATYTANRTIEKFLRNPYTMKNKMISRHLRNSQSNDLGFTTNQLYNRSEGLRYIQELSRDFDLVMLMEYFDESLVLLKRLFCWSLKDILYFPMNKNSLKKKRIFLKPHYDRHMLMSRADYDLYHHFRNEFWDKIWHEGPGFFEEVRYFKDLLHKLQDYCYVHREMEVPDSKWGPGFVVGRADCLYLRLPELAFYDRIREQAFSKFSLGL